MGLVSPLHPVRSNPSLPVISVIMLCNQGLLPCQIAAAAESIYAAWALGAAVNGLEGTDREGHTFQCTSSWVMSSCREAR